MIINKKIPLTFWINLVKKDMIFTLSFSILIYFLSKQVTGIKPPISLATFLGTSIALILSFKLSQSYDRWWEARKIWGSIINDSRLLIMQLINLNKKEDGKLIIKSIAYRQIAWSYALGRSLRGLPVLEGLKSFFSDDEVLVLKESRNIPLKILDIQSKEINKLKNKGMYNDFQHIQLNDILSRLCISIGMLERIKNTHFPKPYRYTLQFFIYLFLVVLTLSISDMDSILEILILALIALPFFLLEKIALMIQDPFENRPMDTPMTSIARTIEINIRELLEEKEKPSPITSDTFYIL